MSNLTMPFYAVEVDEVSLAYSSFDLVSERRRELPRRSSSTPLFASHCVGLAASSGRARPDDRRLFEYDNRTPA